MARALVLTGPPAVGKSTTARRVAERLPRAAVVDVDDVRQLVVSGHAAPWHGSEGRAQQLLGVDNACRLAAAFLAAGYDTVLSDIVDPTTLERYRSRLPAAVVIRLVAAPDELAARATTRPQHLTRDEQAMLLRQDRDQPPPVDRVLDVTGLDLERQTEAVLTAWAELSG